MGVPPVVAARDESASVHIRRSIARRSVDSFGPRGSDLHQYLSPTAVTDHYQTDAHKNSQKMPSDG